MTEPSNISTVLITTTLVAFVSGFALGVYSIQGYLVPPSLRSAREQRLNDPVESGESDIDEDDTVLDHAPNWANGVEADRRQGLRVQDESSKKGKQKKKAEELKEGEAEAEATPTGPHPRQGAVSLAGNPNEECKLVLVVRTDLGMTKGESPPSNTSRSTNLAL